MAATWARGPNRGVIIGELDRKRGSQESNPHSFGSSWTCCTTIPAQQISELWYFILLYGTGTLKPRKCFLLLAAGPESSVPGKSVLMARVLFQDLPGCLLVYSPWF